VLKAKRDWMKLIASCLRLNEEKEKMKKKLNISKLMNMLKKKARNELNLIKPGEKVYVVVEEGSESVVLSETDERKQDEKEEIDKKKQKNWYLWYRLFFDN
jgi:hypothetical protein